MNVSRKNRNTPFSSSATVFGMGSCYALGTFTDNFYKQAAILLAASLQMGSMQSIATVLFSLPFILCSAWAGWLSDRVAKKYIVMAAKTVELLAILAGAFMLVQGFWAGIVAVIFVMGLQATAFGPAINGSIPENFPATHVPRVNSLIKMGSTVAILAGMALAGAFLDMRPASLGGALPDGLVPQKLLYALGAGPGDGAAYGRAIAALFIIGIAALGLLTACILRTIPAAGRTDAQPFPWSGPLDSLRHVLECRGDRELFTVLLAEAYFYGIAAIVIISIANLALTLSYSNTVAGAMTAVLMIGIAVGSLIAGRYTTESWRTLLVPSASGMALMLFLTGLSPLVPAGDGISPQICWIFACLLFCGLCGGLYLIPLSSFIQVRPAAARKGKIQGVSNFMSFMSMGLFGAAFLVVSLFPPPVTFILYSLCTLVFAWAIIKRRIRSLASNSLKSAASGLLSWFLRALLALRYRVREQGLEAIPLVPPSGEAGTGILFLPNHPALIDPLLVYSRLASLGPRPLSDESQMRGPLQSLAARIVRAVTIPDLEKEGRKGVSKMKHGINNIIDALRQGDHVLLYPAGRVYRSAKESLGGNSAVARILSALPGARVVLVRSTGLWGSSFSYAGGNKPRFTRSLLRGLQTLLGNALFFTPRREVDLEFVEPRDLPRDGDKIRLNGYLEAFYRKAERPALAVPRFFWQGSAPFPLPEEACAGKNALLPAIAEDVRERVYALIREQAGLEQGHALEPGMELRADLHMDSLALMELASALETEFGWPLTDLESLVLVGDCLAAAAGLLCEEKAERDGSAILAVPDAWFAAEKEADADAVLTVFKAANVVAAFLGLAKQSPGRAMTADKNGMRTRKQILTGALALSRRFAKLPGKRLGILLPATPAALMAWLAALLAGKEPVLLNWTLGKRNMRHCIAAAGVSHAVTAAALLDQLDRTGNSVRDLPVEFMAAETLAASLSLPEKLRAAILAGLHCSPLPWNLSSASVPEIAAVLFTSGSETEPKAVPLTHANIMTNAADVTAVLKLRRRDRLLAMLPPFHSFGLLAGLVMPASCGLAAAYHPNPTESAPLVSLTRDYRLTTMGATPTFLEAMLKRARGGRDMASLRYVFSGAEKCPEHVYRAFAEICPQASLCEGYGITECSPVVAVNRPEDTLPGSIGHPMPSVVAVLVVEEAPPAPHQDYAPRRARPGETGMLLVRGPSVFAGYLPVLQPDGTTAAPDPFVLFEGERWYRTGDLLSQDAGGRLLFQGRLKRFVKIGGEMISLPLMEAVLQRALAQRHDAPGDGGPAVAIDARPGSEDAGQAEILAFSPLALTVQEINRELRDAGLAPVFAVKGVVRVEEIPLLGTGKTDYRALQKLVSV